MSRVGKHEVEVPESVNLSIEGNIINVKGKLGELSAKIVEGVNVNLSDNKVAVQPINDDKNNLNRTNLLSLNPFFKKIKKVPRKWKEKIPSLKKRFSPRP